VKKKILITGSNGLLGQKLVYALLKRNDTGLIATSKGDNRLNLKEGYIYESMDITSKEEVENVFRKYLPDTVINTAAMTNVDACENDKQNCRSMNVDAVQIMVDALEALKPVYANDNLPEPHFIHLSTDFIFDGEKGPYKEEDVPAPLSYYGESKLDSEKVVQKSKLPWCIIRTIIVYGIADNLSRSNIVLWAKGALEKGQEINVVDDQFRSPTLAEDLAEGCILAAMKGATGIYHISGSEVMSVLELVHKVADHFKLDKSLIKPAKSDTLNQPAKRPPYTGFILDKARRDLGYNPHTFEEGLAVLEEQLQKAKM
jgi:dTDP-4-dehydrorhamnose reductase